jgi:hypothetical protein
VRIRELERLSTWAFLLRPVRTAVTSPPLGRNCDVAIALDVLGHSDDFEGTGGVVVDLSSRWKDGAHNTSRLFLRVDKVRANPVCSRASSAARIRVLWRQASEFRNGLCARTLPWKRKLS